MGSFAPGGPYYGTGVQRSGSWSREKPWSTGQGRWGQNLVQLRGPAAGANTLAEWLTPGKQGWGWTHRQGPSPRGACSAGAGQDRASAAGRAAGGGMAES